MRAFSTKKPCAALAARAALAAQAYTETTTVIVQTTATVEVPVTLHLPAANNLAAPQYATLTLPVLVSGSTAARATTVPVTLLTEAIFRVIDPTQGIFQQYTLKQLAPNQDLSSVVTLHGLTTIAADTVTVNNNAPSTSATVLLGTPPLASSSSSSSSSSSGIVAAATALSTSIASLTSSVTAPSASQTDVFPGNKPVELHGWEIALIVIACLIVLGFCFLPFEEFCKECRDTKCQHHDTPPSYQPGHEHPAVNEKRPSTDEAEHADDPEAVEFAARVRAGMELMESVQQKNRAKKAATEPIYAVPY